LVNVPAAQRVKATRLTQIAFLKAQTACVQVTEYGAGKRAPDKRQVVDSS
jgi:hypothetical protein